MSVFKCKICGGTIEFQEGATVGTCDSCGTRQTLPHLDDDRRANLYDRANHFRRNNEFDKAAAIYEQILTEDTTDAEAYWSLVLCQYGIEYVEDPATHKRVPTVNRAQFTSIFDDDNYKSALQYADGYQRELYEAEAKTINDIQKGILAISQKEEPFDVFICYKETDKNGRRTPDSVLANDLYHQLIQEGFKVFFSRITLEDKLGTAYEPYIFAALNSAKVMVVLGTKPEHFNSVWVKNEWSRYLALVKKSGGKKVLIPAYRDMDPYDLPEEFSHLQAQDMSKLGFMQDLIRGIKKLLKTDESRTNVKETVVINQTNTNVAPLLERAFLFLEDGKWQDANTYCEKVLDIDPKNADAYLGKLMVDLQVRSRKSLADCAAPFDNRDNYAKVLRFGDEKLEIEMRGYITHINERNEKARLTAIYNSAVGTMNTANNEAEYKSAAEMFKSITGFKDADLLCAKCLERAEVCRKDAIYAFAKSQMARNKVNGYESAISIFRTIPGWKDTEEQISFCHWMIEDIKVKEESARLERERKAEERRIAVGKRRKKAKKILAIVMSIIIACIAFAIILITVIIPTARYNAAMNLYNAGKYDEAITVFEALNGYKDSETKITKCETAIKDAKYSSAVSLMEAGKYDEAITEFMDLNGYKDSTAQITKCRNAIKEEKYNSAVSLMEAGKYDEAITEFEALNGYNDSAAQITKCENAIKDRKYNSAVSLIEAGKYDEAITAFKSLNGFRDSAAQITKCENAIKDQKYNAAVSLIDEGKYINAYEILIGLNGFKDSTQKAISIFSQYVKASAVGDIVYFGSYEQDNNKSNGKENIEWLVLAKEDNKALLISKKALDAQNYNTLYTDVTWETCSLRIWLNETFLNAAFSSEEQNKIISSTVTADKNNVYKNTPAGNNTIDKVFLLSIPEVEKYFSSDNDRACKPTEYAIEQGILLIGYKPRGDSSWWWLRSPGKDSKLAATVLNNGSLRKYGSRIDGDGSILAVRPALWIDLGF